MKNFRVFSVLAALVAVSALYAASAGAAAPDKWVRWTLTPKSEVTIRSLDFLGSAVFAGGDTDGVFTSPVSGFGKWTQQNDGLDPQTGAQSVRQVKLGPNGLLYAATSGGLFSAQPGGAWSPVGQGSGPRKLNMGGIQSIVFNDPSGTDMTVAVSGAGGAGVYYTSDGGSTWDRASGMNAPENVYYLTSNVSGTPIYAAADEGVYISFDFGRSWVLTSDGIPPGETTLRVAYVPGSGGGAVPTDLYASTSSGVYRSKTGGLQWEEVEGSDGQTLPAAGAKRAFLLTPALKGQFGAHRGLIGTESGVYATIDDGEHWRQMSTEVPAGPNMNRVVWALGLGLTPPSLLAGTAGFGVYSLLMQPIEAGKVTIGPVSGLKAGTELTSKLEEWEGTRPYFFDYQWKRCEGNGCTPSSPIAGAVGPTYVIPNADAGKRVRYMLTVTGRNLVHPSSVSDDSNLTFNEDVATLPGTNPMPSTVFAEKPKLSPSTSEPWGTVFTVVNGKWRTEKSATEIKPTFKYRWQRCDSNGANCVDLLGETEQTYTSTPADIAHELKAFIRGTFGGQTGGWYSAGEAQDLLNKVPVNTVAPKIVGEPIAGMTLGSSAGGWDGYDMSYEKRWLRCESNGLGCNPTSPVVTASTFVLSGADVGKRLKLEVTAVAEDKNQDRRTTTFSEPTAVIANPPAAGGGGGGGGGSVPPPAKPAVSVKKAKKLKPGKSLSVPTAFAGYQSAKYQWLRNGKAIKGATKSSYKIVKKDRGKKVSCRITLTPVGGGAAVVVTTQAVKVPKAKRKKRR